MSKFTLNDESVRNSYGFKINTAGIHLARFEKNPVMLDGHINSNLSVIGRWINIKKENGLLTAETDFDPQDENAQNIAGKVERGLIKGASMGISFHKKDLKMIDNELTLTACELYEASIVAIPSNANALRLTMDGEELTETDIKSLCLSIAQDSHETIKPDFYTMKLKLSQLAFMALGFHAQTTEATEQEVNTAILALEKEKNELKAQLKLSEEKVNAFLKKEEEQKQNLATELVENAIKDGRITADKKQDFMSLALQNFDLAKSALEAIPTKKSFSTDVKTPAGTTAVATMEDFQKLSLQEQLTFKNDNPEAYQQILRTI